MMDSSAAVSPAISVEALTVTYSQGRRQTPAVCNVSFSVAAGEVFGFLGPNGAGKTTTIKALVGLVPASSGRIELCGLSPTLPAARHRVGFMPETAVYYWYVTPRELLRFYGACFGMSAAHSRQAADRLLAVVGMDEHADTLFKYCSKGMMQRISLAQALINDPSVLILDEPLSGLDPLARRQMRDIILSLRAAGTTVFFSSHELSEAELICDRVAVLHKGCLLKNAPLASLLEQKGQRKSLEQYFVDLIQGQKS